MIAERCPPLPVMDNAAVVSDYTSDINSTVTVHCQKGHKFKDGKKTKELLCLDNIKWEDGGDCMSK